MMQPNFQELIGKTMSNLTFGLADGNFTWGEVRRLSHRGGIALDRDSEICRGMERRY